MIKKQSTQKGLITESRGGFYNVEVSPEKTYVSRARGLFRKDGTTPYVGDFVEIEIINEDEAYIVEILPRRNYFIRPPLANVDCFIMTIAAKRPEPSLYVLDKLLVTAEYWGTSIVVCLNKEDIANDGEIGNIEEIYKDLYKFIVTSGKSGLGISDLARAIQGKKAAFAGPSGVGKSTLLNRLHETALAETGAISEKTERGKHTTRHVELFHINENTMVFDTPGFTSLELPQYMEEDELEHLYPEMKRFLGACKFHNCRHENEPDCKVREAFEAGEIAPSRYESYLRQLKEIREQRRF